MSRFQKLLLAGLLLLPLAAAAQEASPFPVKLSGTVDAYYLVNLGLPQTEILPTRVAATVPYDGRPGFNLNFAKVSAQMDAAPAGFRVDLGFAPQTASIGNFLVQQAYASMKLGPVSLDLGRFVTPAGVEVYETKDNFLVSRGLLYSWALPTAHEGLRLSLPVFTNFTASAYLANGNDLSSNDTGGNLSPYKTGILSGVYSKDATFAALNLFVTKNPATGQDGFLVDVVLTQGFGPVTVNLSGDYGMFGTSRWLGAGLQARLSLFEDRLRLAGRVEYFDPDGLRTATAGGVNFMDVTVGAGIPVGQNAELRGELRVDRASKPVFHPADPRDVASTVQLSAMAWF